MLFWSLTIIAIIALLPFLGETLFNTKGEPREAVVALSMLQTGDWISPINNGVDIAYKPPFFHWCVALCSLFIGKVTEFTSRLPSAIATIIMVLVMYRCMIKNKIDERLAFITGAVTLTAFEVHRAAMACRVDMVLSSLTVVAILIFQRWHATRKNVFLPIVVLLLSGAFLTKGPVGALLPCVVMGAYMLLRGERLYKAIAISLALVLAASVLPVTWYYSAYQERGNEFLYLVYEENVLRLLGKMAYSSHEAPAIYNVGTMLSGFLPYTLFAVAALFTVKYRLPHFEGHAGIAGRLQKYICRQWNKLKRMPDYDLLALIGAVIIFVFYCIPKSKRSVYLLPVYPFAAYYLSKLIIWMVSQRHKVAEAFGWLIVTLAILVPVVSALLMAGVVPVSVFHGKHATENIAYIESFTEGAWDVAFFFAIVATAFAVWVFVKRRNRSPYWFCGSLTVLVVALNISLDGVVLPRILGVKSDYKMASEIAKLVPPEENIWDYRHDWKPGERSRMHQFTVNFYIGDRIVPLDFNKPKAGYIIMGDDDYLPFVKKYPCYRLVKVKSFKHKSCDDKRFLTLYTFSMK